MSGTKLEGKKKGTERRMKVVKRRGKRSVRCVLFSYQNYYPTSYTLPLTHTHIQTHSCHQSVSQ